MQLKRLKPRRWRRRRKRNNMQTTAQLNNLRIAPRKVRLVARAIKGMDIVRAEQQLNFLTKRSAGPLGKLLKSAIANAENNLGLVKENLFIKDMIVNEGVKIKRFMPRAMGQAGLIQKRTSRVKVVLAEKVAGLKAPKLQPKVEAKAAETVEEKKQKEKLKGTKQSEPKQEISKKGVFGDVKNIGRKLFRRKSV